MQKNSSNERIIRRIKGLLKLAEDNSNMEESQSAFLKAQRMMVKFGVNQNEVSMHQNKKEILEKSTTEYKRLWWWERKLASVVASNFRCDWYYNSKRFKGNKHVKRKIIFVGYEQDVELATEMYNLVHAATKFYSNLFAKTYIISGHRGKTVRAKSDYIRGFIDGLEQKFEEQISNQEWGLSIITPAEVIDRTNEITKDGQILSWETPDLESYENYQKGYIEGSAIDYTKSTIDEESFIV